MKIPDSSALKASSAPSKKKPLYKSLFFQILIAVVAGVLIGHFWPDLGAQLRPLGDGFIQLIKMIIAPLIFCVVVTGIAAVGDIKAVGRIGLKAVVYFEVVTTFALLFGLLVALLLFPPCRWLERRGWARAAAISLLLVLIVLLFLGAIFLLGIELDVFVRQIPTVARRLAAMAGRIQGWLELKYRLSRDVQAGWTGKMVDEAGQNLAAVLGGLLNTTVSTVVTLVMIPVYAALFLYHRGTFVYFLSRMAGAKLRERLPVILEQSILSYFRFVRGTLFVYCIVGALNSLGLFLLGIDKPLLYGMTTAFMTFIPYIGILISASIPVSIALITRDEAWYPLAVVAVFSFVQYLEGNVIFPRVVGKQLSLSTWATLVGLIAGTILWGVPGMILFIPFLAMLKIVSDNIPEWEALNVLLDRDKGYHRDRQAAQKAGKTD